MTNNSVWKLFGFQYNQAVADRDCLRTKIRRRLGSETGAEIQFHVEIALGRLKAHGLPNPQIMAMHEFYQLLAAELAVQEIASRIQATAVFHDHDPVHG